MRCPFCNFEDTKVVDSRSIDGKKRRRRECTNCGKRFTTFEMIEAMTIVVEKKNGSKELFDRSKLLGGILKATQKRPVNAEQIVNDIEAELQNSLRSEVKSIEIGSMVMDKLKAIDEVAYVRFASVYREFRDVDSFLDELRRLKSTDQDEQ